LGSDEKALSRLAVPLLPKADSLGAALAEIMAMEFGLPACTFDSPGCEPMVRGKPHFSTHQDLVIAYLSQPNLVNVCHTHIGKIFFLNPGTELRARADFFAECGRARDGMAAEVARCDECVETHRMRTILTAFDPETGEPLNARLVEAWPTRGELCVGSTLRVVDDVVIGAPKLSGPHR
jgi:hypothetical protein